MVKKGRCTNIGACKSAGKIFEVDTDEKPFECPDCGEPLQEVKDDPSSYMASSKKKKQKKTGAILASLFLVIIIIVGCIFAFSGGKSDKSSPVDSLAVDSLAIDSAKAVKADTVTVLKTDTVTQTDTIKQVDTVEVEKIVEKPVVVEKHYERVIVKETPSSTASASQAKKTSLSLGYGTYNGDIKNGKPNGSGKLVYSSSHLIDSRDSKGRVAEPGDYIIGEWVDGKLVQGRWYDSSNTVKGSIIIGM